MPTQILGHSHPVWELPGSTPKRCLWIRCGETERSGWGRAGAPRGRLGWCGHLLAHGLFGLARLDESGFVGVDDGLCAVVEAELGEHVRDVGLDGGVADVELVGD